MIEQGEKKKQQWKKLQQQIQVVVPSLFLQFLALFQFKPTILSYEISFFSPLFKFSFPNPCLGLFFYTSILTLNLLLSVLLYEVHQLLHHCSLFLSFFLSFFFPINFLPYVEFFCQLSLHRFSFFFLTFIRAYTSWIQYSFRLQIVAKQSRIGWLVLVQWLVVRGTEVRSDQTVQR